MLLHIPEVFTKDEVATLRARLDAGPWADGNATSGHQSATAKRNMQLPEGSTEAVEVGGGLLDELVLAGAEAGREEQHHGRGHGCGRRARPEAPHGRLVSASS